MEEDETALLGLTNVTFTLKNAQMELFTVELKLITVISAVMSFHVIGVCQA